jgi:CO/xanthine dehydrogenase FAD-binding subunit
VPFVCAELANELSRDRKRVAALDTLIERELAKLQGMSDVQADAQYRRVLAGVLLHDCVKELLQ